MRLAESLISHAAWSERIGKGVIISWRLGDTLGRRFLVADYLWCICEVIGPAMQKQAWWGNLMEKYLDVSIVASRFQRKSGNRALIIKRLIDALLIYRAGERPHACEVVTLKQEILCKANRPERFKSPAWDPWRMDNGNTPLRDP